MRQELVERRRWISERRFLHALNYCMLLPGPGAAACHPHRLIDAPHRGRGIVVGGLFVLPGALIMMALAWAIFTLARPT